MDAINVYNPQASTLIYFCIIKILILYTVNIIKKF